MTWASAFDDRFDEFWERLKRERAGTLLAVRSREVLAWHFRTTLAEKRLWIATICNGGRLAGYAVFDKREDAESGLKRVRILDCQVLDDVPEGCRRVLAAAVDRCRAEGIDFLEDHGCWFTGPRYLNRPAPHRNVLESWSYFYKPSDESVACSLRSAEIWSPTDFDGDACL